MRLHLEPFTHETLTALASGDADLAGDIFGHPLPDELVAETWVWTHYADLLAARPEVEGWITEALLDGDVVVGYAGFHEPPDDDGMVELGYTILTPYRGRGIATACVAMLVEIARARGVRTLQGYVSPDNVASVKVLTANEFTFMRVVDSKRGPQRLFERQLTTA